MEKIVGYLGLFMGIFFAGSGLFIAIKQLFPAPRNIFNYEFTYFKENLDHFNYIVGALLLAYGIFRIVRSVRILKSRQI